jgi:hypothetical protein
VVYLILPRLIKDLTDFCNKDDSVSIEIVEHYVYSRLLTQKEQEDAEKLYEMSIEQRAIEENKTEVSNFLPVLGSHCDFRLPGEQDG